MPKKFTNIPIEEDTRILFQKKGKLGGFDIRYETWSWDGIEAESIIFANADVEDLTDQEIENLVRITPMVKQGSAMTLNRSTDFTFVNFNFE